MYSKLILDSVSRNQLKEKKDNSFFFNSNDIDSQKSGYSLFSGCGSGCSGSCQGSCTGSCSGDCSGGCRGDCKCSWTR